MLVGESELLDLQEVGIAQEPIEIDTEGVGSQLGLQAGTQAPERVRMVGFDIELLGQLAVDGLDDLAGAVQQVLDRIRDLLLLIALWQSQ